MAGRATVAQSAMTAQPRPATARQVQLCLTRLLRDQQGIARSAQGRMKKTLKKE
jgi:hypothetical protein